MSESMKCVKAPELSMKFKSKFTEMREKIIFLNQYRWGYVYSSTWNFKKVFFTFSITHVTNTYIHTHTRVSREKIYARASNFSQFYSPTI